MRKNAVILLLCFLAIALQFCTKKDEPSTDVASLPQIPAATLNYVEPYPQHIQNALSATDNTPANNLITNDGATLGRILFYDKRLSKNNTISCGSCHQQSIAFDDNRALSKGFDGGFTTRNSMSLLNTRFYKSGKMFWDERAATLEKQVLQPIQNHVEMGLTLAELEAKVKAASYYPALFQKAFGSEQVDSIRIAKALSQFVRSMVTYRSKYDRVKQGLETFTPAEAQGEQLFMNAAAPNTCNSCHTAPMFITSTPLAVFGLMDPKDAGINGSPNFKSGSLRNIIGRNSLFHNGSITNLQAMLSTGGPGVPPIPHHSVAPNDVQNLIAFFNTLTDAAITTDERFSDPFK